ncbi:MAG: sugar transporter permease [Paenibacillaceae bacterium]|nr:sugar transporter permease [Paenibacillaceae bacterium]
MEEAKLDLSKHKLSKHNAIQRNSRITVIKKALMQDRFLYMLLIPFLAWYVVFEYTPMYGLQVAFKEYKLFKGILGSEWVGLQHFQDLFGDPYFWRNLKNTFLISFYNLLFAFPAPIALALLLNEVKHALFKRVVQTLTYLPHFVSIVIVAGLVTNFLAPTSGLFNIILDKLGFEKIYFLTKAEYFRTIYISSTIWKEVGFGAILYIAALSGINPELYEAAVIDGANKWKRVLHVTLPGIAPTIIIMLILKIGSLLSVGYEYIILLYQPSTYSTADVISTYVYRTGLQEGKYDFATAVGFFNSVVSLTLIFIANKMSQKVSETSLW